MVFSKSRMSPRIHANLREFCRSSRQFAETPALHHALWAGTICYEMLKHFKNRVQVLADKMYGSPGR
jgi:hypothetical protein